MQIDLCVCVCVCVCVCDPDVKHSGWVSCLPWCSDLKIVMPIVATSLYSLLHHTQVSLIEIKITTQNAFTLLVCSLIKEMISLSCVCLAHIRYQIF